MIRHDIQAGISAEAAGQIGREVSIPQPWMTSRQSDDVGMRNDIKQIPVPGKIAKNRREAKAGAHTRNASFLDYRRDQDKGRFEGCFQDG